jgi:hypothetical protein
MNWSIRVKIPNKNIKRYYNETESEQTRKIIKPGHTKSLSKAVTNV